MCLSVPLYATASLPGLHDITRAPCTPGVGFWVPVVHGFRCGWWHKSFGLCRWFSSPIAFKSLFWICSTSERLHRSSLDGWLAATKPAVDLSVCRGAWRFLCWPSVDVAIRRWAAVWAYRICCSCSWFAQLCSKCACDPVTLQMGFEQ